MDGWRSPATRVLERLAEGYRKRALPPPKDYDAVGRALLEGGAESGVEFSFSDRGCDEDQ
jgi:hypothetical protein